MNEKIWPRAANATLSKLSSLVKNQTGRLFWTGKEAIKSKRRLFIEDGGALVEIAKVADLRLNIHNDVLQLKHGDDVIDSVSLRKYEEISDTGKYTYGTFSAGSGY